MSDEPPESPGKPLLDYERRPQRATRVWRHLIAAGAFMVFTVMLLVMIILSLANVMNTWSYTVDEQRLSELFQVGALLVIACLMSGALIRQFRKHRDCSRT